MTSALRSLEVTLSGAAIAAQFRKEPDQDQREKRKADREQNDTQDA
jgi:hypothetical protein